MSSTLARSDLGTGSTTDRLGSTFTGTAPLLGLALRRDRIALPATVLTFAAIVAASAATAGELYDDEAERVSAANIINATAALVALYGRILDPTSLGAVALFKLTAWGAAMVGVAMIIFVVRHTRTEEETGRLELLGAGAVGRHAPLAAGLLVGAIGSAGIGILTTIALLTSGFATTGSVAFGLGWALTGLVFGCVAAVTAQVTTSGRAATGLALIVLLVAYVLRAIGDLAEQPLAALSWLSPIGWNQHLRPYADENWLVPAIPLMAAAALAASAFALRSRRDLGGGLLRDRPGPAEGRIHGPIGLAWRLQRPTLTAWLVGFAVMGVLLGSVADSMTDLLDSPDLARIIALIGGEQALTDAFLAAELSIAGIIAAAYGVIAVSRLRAEEELGHAEVVLAHPVPRSRWLFSHTVVALAGTALLILTIGAAIGTAHGTAVGEADQVLRLALASAARIPAAWLFVGLAVAAFGWAPRLIPVVWSLLIGSIIVGEFGPLWSLPAWVIDLSPFAHSPLLPAPQADLTGLIWLSLAAAGLLLLGFLGWRRRDTTTH